MKRALLALVTVGLLAAAWLVPTSAEALPGSTPTPPIEHLVVIMEENSTFDHVFGWLPMADGKGLDQPIPQGNRNLRMNGFSQLGPHAFEVSHGEEVLSNGPTAAQQSWDNGKMDGFYRAQVAAGKRPRLSFTQIDPDAKPPWGLLAEQGVVFDRYFSSEMAGSLPNTLNLVSGSSQGRNTGSSDEFRSLWNSDIRTIFDAADHVPTVSWRYYVGGLQDIREHKVADGAYARSGQATPSQLYWAPILSMKRFWTDPRLAINVRTQNDLYSDAAAGDLANITYILPQPTSHEPQVESPDLRILSIVNAIRTSPDWPSTAIMITWDDWGGYYDHVAPPPTSKSGGQQLGFRVPMILLSPYAMRGQVSHELLDHSSIPAFAASLFDLRGNWTPHTNDLRGVWTPTPDSAPQITALSQEPRYAAAGMQHASSVFVLYLMTLVVITGVLFALGVTFRAARPEGKRTQP
jgi:phospholipase C